MPENGFLPEPTDDLKADLTSIVVKDTKIDMDTGAAFRGVAWVLNVLTMQAQGFEDVDITNKEIRKHDVKKIYSIQM